MHHKLLTGIALFHWTQTRGFFISVPYPLLATRTTKGITFNSSGSGSLCSFAFNLQVPFSKLLCAWVCQIYNQWSLLRAEYQNVLFIVHFILFNTLPVSTPVDSCTDSGSSIGALPVSYPQIPVAWDAHDPYCLCFSQQGLGLSKSRDP